MNKVNCPHCGAEYEVEQEDMYQYTTCEVCGKGFVVGTTTNRPADEQNHRPVLKVRRTEVSHQVADEIKYKAVESVVNRARIFEELKDKEIRRRRWGLITNVVALIFVLIGAFVGYDLWSTRQEKAAAAQHATEMAQIRAEAERNKEIERRRLEKVATQELLRAQRESESKPKEKIDQNNESVHVNRMYFVSIVSRVNDVDKVHITSLSGLPDKQKVLAYFFPDFEGQRHYLVIQDKGEDDTIRLARLMKDGNLEEVDRLRFEKALLRAGYYVITDETVYFCSPEHKIEVANPNGDAEKTRKEVVIKEEIVDPNIDEARVAEDEKPIPKKILDDSALFELVKDKLVIVQCDEASGSGFVCEMDGKKYMVTNKHVIEGQSRVVAMFSDGKELKLGNLEIASNADLVRFLVPDNKPSLNLRNDEPKMNESIFVFGNSDGERVLTDLKGQIIGIGADRLEVTAKFVHGNSGSAVLDEQGEVVGVATYAIKASDPKDWVKADTRFGDVRRFALRIRDIKWVKTDLKAFKRKIDQEEFERKKRLGILPEVKATFKGASLRVNKDAAYSALDAMFFVNGNITLSLSSRNCKNPVVRVVVLVDCGSCMYVFDRVATKPKGAYDYRSLPIISYGMKNTGWYWALDASSCVYYLEGLSYHQRKFAGKIAKDIEYFDRSKQLTGGFLIPKDLVANGYFPKIIAYRFECWQNGSLAGVFNSMRPQTLNAKGIPVDWFVLWKYPKLFEYPESRATMID